jgi:hypothetical protein
MSNIFISVFSLLLYRLPCFRFYFSNCPIQITGVVKLSNTNHTSCKTRQYWDFPDRRPNFIWFTDDAFNGGIFSKSIFQSLFFSPYFSPLFFRSRFVGVNKFCLFLELIYLSIKWVRVPEGTHHVTPTAYPSTPLSAVALFGGERRGGYSIEGYILISISWKGTRVPAQVMPMAYPKKPYAGSRFG